ncbi:MAG TPA: hypothetical protein VL096_05600 [Pirellulaceae bacterium]|nr:hypothetical protein [Pirellulaceae bacterium]
MTLTRICGLALLTFVSLSTFALAADDETTLKLGDEGKLTLQAPKEWTKKKPTTNIVQYEFAIPKAEGDEIDGRVTVMGAGGSVEANIERWVGQFQTEGGKPLGKEQTKVEKTKIDGLEVHLVDLSGTYKDQTRPFGGQTTIRENYRMLGAIIIGGEQGNYFVKAYGPKKTMDAHAKEFTTMLESLKAK